MAANRLFYVCAGVKNMKRDKLIFMNRNLDPCNSVDFFDISLDILEDYVIFSAKKKWLFLNKKFISPFFGRKIGVTGSWKLFQVVRSEADEKLQLLCRDIFFQLLQVSEYIHLKKETFSRTLNQKIWKNS